MLLPKRHGSVDSYRYGFNAKEKDDEIKGEGTQYDYGFRIYDSRLGKFLSEDPLTTSYPWLTPYQFAGNKPIIAIDLDGLEERIVNYYTTEDERVIQVTIDSKDLLIKTEAVGIEHSARYQKITNDQWNDVKKQLWDGFSGVPDSFDSGYSSYTLGMENKGNGFTGPNRGTLTISTYGGNNTLFFDSGKIERKGGTDWGLVWDAIKKYNYIYQVETETSDSRDKAYVKTGENIRTAIGTVFPAGAYSEASGVIVKIILASDIAVSADDMTGIIDNEGVTISENALGKKTTAIIKTAINVANLANGILDLKNIKNDPTKTVNEKRVETAEAAAGIVSDASDAADNANKLNKE